MAGMRREEEAEEEEEERETDTEGLRWNKWDPLGEGWSFSGSAARIPNVSEEPNPKPLWWLGIGEEEEEGSVESSLLEKTTSSSIRSSSSLSLSEEAAEEGGFWRGGAWDATPRKRPRDARVGLRLRNRVGSFRSIIAGSGEVNFEGG